MSRSRPSSKNPPLLPGGDRALHVALGLLAIGLAIALYLVRHSLRIGLDPDYQSACNLGAKLDCDAVNTSKWSKLLGLPLALYAVPTYSLLAWLLWTALRAAREGGEESRTAGRNALAVAAAIGLATVAHSLFLAGVSTFAIGAYCLFCMGLYAVNLGVTLLVLRAAGLRPGRAVSQALHAVADLAPPLLPAAGVLVIAAGTAWSLHDLWKERMQARYFERIEARFSADGGAVATPRPAEPTAPAQARPSPAPAEARTSPAPAGARATGPRARRPADAADARTGGEKTEQGWSWFQAPLDEETEYWGGNPEASLTVVEFLDFQCDYCAVVARNLAPLKEKYADRVRFVVRNYPLDPECNPRARGYTDHPNACEAAYAGHCAGAQGAFWAMHDRLFEHQDELDRAALSGHAAALGLDLDAFESCMASDAPQEAVRSDLAAAATAGIFGTPRIYVGNRLVSGAANTSVLDYYIRRSLEAGGDAPAPAGTEPSPAEPRGASTAAAETPAPALPAPTRSMAAFRLGDEVLWMDRWEAAVTRDGRAVSQAGVEPAQLSWFDARAACEAAGKRLCVEREWIAACSGRDPVDENGNGWFNDDPILGALYPYGAFYSESACEVTQDDVEGRALPTGRREACVTPTGLHDLAGNVAEWVGAEEERASLMGGYFGSQNGATCSTRNGRTQPGARNTTTGFRCCSDVARDDPPVPAASLRPNRHAGEGDPAPAFQALDADGAEAEFESVRGRVTLLNFFASWCGPCRREFPWLVKLHEKYREQGFQVVAVGLDDVPSRSLGFAERYGPEFPVLTDAAGRVKGLYSVHGMPATYLIDEQGVIRHAGTGFDPATSPAKLEALIRSLL